MTRYAVWCSKCSSRRSFKVNTMDKAHDGVRKLGWIQTVLGVWVCPKCQEKNK